MAHSSIPPQIAPVAAEQREQFEWIYRQYRDGMAQLPSLDGGSGTLRPFDTTQLDPYWRDTHHHPYWAYVGKSPVAFAVVHSLQQTPALQDMEQFFVLKEYRRTGVGESLFRFCMQTHPGQWQIRVMQNNLPGYAFWERVIKHHTAGQYSCAIETDVDLDMHFFRFATLPE